MLDELKEIAAEAGKIMLENRSFSVHSKGTAANYVSDIDINVEKFLRERLTALCPEAAFIGEESDSNDYTAEKMWIVDPIDGTANFVRDMDMSAVSIALVENGEAIMGVVYNPYVNRMLYSEKGRGAYMNGEKIHVSTRPLENSIISIAMSVYKKEYAPMCFTLAEKMQMQCEDIRRIGSAAIELCNLAAGKIEMFFEARLYPWDFAAASLFVREAGGYIASLGSDLVYDRVIPIIAANSKESFELLQKEAAACFDGIDIL
ncbi:MAG: inositol monophosphatase family protein [Hominilimicola sp.]